MDDEERAKFDAFFTASWPRLFRFVSVVAGDGQMAEDALQVAMARAARRWRRVAGMASPEAYVRRIAINEVLASRRKKSSRLEVAVSEPHELQRVPANTVSDTSDPSSLWDSVMALPPRQRAIIVLRYYDDLSEAEIAEALGCRPGTVKSQASAAMSTL